MKLEAVTVCVDYADFLAETLPLNRQHFDRLVVVTAPHDNATRRLCEHHYVQVVVTDAFGIDHGEFNKGAAINEGLARLDMDGWTVHLDSDIALPPQTRQILERQQLNQGVLYGIDRHNLIGWKAWAGQSRHPRLQHEAGVYVHADAYPVATRFCPDGYEWLPVGYFQLWHPGGSGVSRYPASHTDAGRTDMLFARQWPRERRQLLPELIGYHLESERCAQGANWNGRTTRPFAPGFPWWPWLWWDAWKRYRRRHRHHKPHPYL